MNIFVSIEAAHQEPDKTLPSVERRSLTAWAVGDRPSTPTRILDCRAYSNNIDDIHAGALIRKLREEGFKVDHSPRNPNYGDDDRWYDWYAKGCQEALDQTEIFISVINQDWEYSTWMLHESYEALKRLERGVLKKMFSYNPDHIAVTCAGFAPVLLNQSLPVDLEDVVKNLICL